MMMRRVWMPQLMATVLLVWALNPSNPYGFYVLLRWICCAVFAFLAVQTFHGKQRGWTWVLGVTAGIYNPVVPARLSREIWSVVNLIAIGIAVVSVFAVKKKTDATARTPADR